MITFKTVTHVGKGTEIIEIWEEHELIAIIYPMHGGIRIVSKHFGKFPARYHAEFIQDSPTALHVRIK